MQVEIADTNQRHQAFQRLGHDRRKRGRTATACTQCHSRKQKVWFR